MEQVRLIMRLVTHGLATILVLVAVISEHVEKDREEAHHLLTWAIFLWLAGSV